MPRKSRIDVPGSIQHIIFRGIERTAIFRDSQDRENFLNRLGIGDVGDILTFYRYCAILPYAP